MYLLSTVHWEFTHSKQKIRMRENIRVICFLSYYLPGFKNGGPVRSVLNMCQRLNQDYDFRVLTRDRDRGDSLPYERCTPLRWYSVGGGRVLYLPKPYWSPKMLRKAVLETEPDLLYFHSFFDPALTIVPLILRRLGLISKAVPVLIAPRGEFSPGALNLKRRKKKAFIRAAKVAGLYKDVIWHATGTDERDYIRMWWGDGARIEIAPNLPPKTDFNNQMHLPKQVGAVHIAFFSRIARNKNLHGALAVLARVSVQVRFDIYGPKEDIEYWAECERLIAQLPTNVVATYKGALVPENVMPTLVKHDLFFLPTLGENFGHVILEALIAGCPVLLSDQTPWRDLSSKKIGFDIPLDQPDRFKEVIEQFAAMGDEEHRAWSESARLYGIHCADNRESIRATKAMLNGAMGL